MSKERKKKKSKMVPIIKIRVTDELRKQNISQAKMCDKIGISREYFSRRLKAGQISEYFLSLVADFLGCSTEWLSDPSVTIKTVAAKQLFDARYNEKIKQDILYNMFVLFGLNPMLLNRMNENEINSMIFEMKDIALQYCLGNEYFKLFLDTDNDDDNKAPGRPTTKTRKEGKENEKE